MATVELTIDGHRAGYCDADVLDLVIIYLAEGRKEVDIARELKASGIDHATTIVVNAKRMLNPGSTGNV